jgi:predicted transcriptional regulator
LDKASVVRICIDDFALKRRYRYGTVMVDIDTGHIIDLLESRETDDVAKWLITYPNIQVVSRDGSNQYAAAIKQAHPDAGQVNDRFHLIKNLTDYAKQHIAKVVSTNFRIPAKDGETCTGGGYWEKPECHGADLPEREHATNTEKKREIVEKTRSLAAQGLSKMDIAKEVGISSPTVKKYLDMNFDPASNDFGNHKPSMLKPYTDKIDAMLRERRTFKEIESAIREEGYNGAASTSRMYATRQRRILKATNAESLENTELIERKWITKLLYKPIEKIKEITESQVERIIKEHPVIGNLYDIVRSFKEMAFAKRVDEIDGWIEDARRFGIDEINSFVNGIVPDLDAVKNAIRYEYNNGLAEGSVNKLKLTKRIMYGRCNFNLLHKKSLLKEYYSSLN